MFECLQPCFLHNLLLPACNPLHDGPEHDAPFVPGAVGGVSSVPHLGLELFDRLDVDLQLPDQPGAGEPDVQLQVAVPRRLLGGLALAVEPVLDSEHVDAGALEREHQHDDAGDVVAHDAGPAEVLQLGEVVEVGEVGLLDGPGVLLVRAGVEGQTECCRDRRNIVEDGAVVASNAVFRLW